MKEEWLAILVTAVGLLLGLGSLARLILKAGQPKGAPLPPLPSQCILFPLGSAFPANTPDAVKEASQLLSGGGKLLLTLAYPVPRATALEKAAPSPEELALLTAVQQAAEQAGCSVETLTHPCRSAQEEVLKLAAQHQASAIFVRHSEAQESVPEAPLLQRAPCALYLSYQPPT